MNKRNKITILIVISLFCISCYKSSLENKDETIKITILNNLIKSNSDTVYYKIENLSNKKILFPIDDSNFQRKEIDEGHITFLEPVFEIANSKGAILNPEELFINPSEESWEEMNKFNIKYGSQQDSILNLKIYNNLSKKEYLNRFYFERNLKEIPPNHAIVLKTPIYINYYKRKNNTVGQAYTLHKDSSYYIKVKFDMFYIPKDFKSCNMLVKGTFESNIVPIDVVEFW